MSNSRNIFQQIQQSSYYYGPDTYLRSNLDVDTHQFTIQSDPLSTSFVPLTTAKFLAEDSYLPFIIGFIPPSANVTGRLLTRNTRTETTPVQAPVEQAGLEEKTVDPPPQEEAAGTGDKITKLGVSKSGYCIVDPKTGPSREGLSDSFWVKYVQMCQRLGVDPFALAAVIDSESSWRPGSQYITGGNLNDARKDPSKIGVVAQGLNQIHESNIGKNKLLDMPPELWKCFGELPAEDQLPWVEKFFMGKQSGKSSIRGLNAGQIYARNAGGYPNPDGSIYAAEGYMNGWNATENAKATANPAYKPRLFTNLKGNAQGFNGNKDVSSDGQRITRDDLAKRVANKPSEGIKAKIQQAIDRLAGSSPPPYNDPTGKNIGTTANDPKKTKEANDQWQKGGKDDANTSQKALVKENKKTQKVTGLQEKYQKAQRATILYLQDRLEAMANTPPLRMLINPSSFSVSHSKLINDGGWARTGSATHVIEHWGDNQDKISVSGKIGGFFALDASYTYAGSAGNSPGITRNARNLTEAYANLMSLLAIYKNNGAIYVPEGQDPALGNQNNLSMLGSIYIYFDGMIYIGSFDSMSMKEDEASPFTVEYSFEFTVRSSFLLDKDASTENKLKTTNQNPSAIPTNVPTKSNKQTVPQEAIADIPLPAGSAALIRSRQLGTARPGTTNVTPNNGLPRGAIGPGRNPLQ